MIDNATQLALMAKASRVFAAADTFLSFPITPLILEGRDLHFSLEGNATEVRNGLHALLEFSKLVNRIPTGEAWMPSAEHYLWDVYAELLDEAELAASNRTPDEEARYRQALADLDDAAVMTRYLQCRDDYNVAQQLYVSDRSSAESSDDPEELRRWKSEEPLRRAELDALMTSWLVTGNKGRVEELQATVIQLSAKSPLLTWADWKSRFNPDVDGLTDPAQPFVVFPTSFSPGNAVDEHSWLPFSLSAREVTHLIGQAPTEVRDRLGAMNAAASSLSSLSFEFSSALLERPWFDEGAFRARFWRAPSAPEPISDGKTPAQGTCPAYVTGLVFARHVVATEKATASPSAASSPPKALPLAFDWAKQQPPNARVQPLKAPLPARPTAPQTKPAPSSTLPAGKALSAPAPVRKPRQATPTSKPQPPPTPTARADDSIQVLAFICSTVPKCPNPDPKLQWPKR